MAFFLRRVRATPLAATTATGQSLNLFLILIRILIQARVLTMEALRAAAAKAPAISVPAPARGSRKPTLGKTLQPPPNQTPRAEVLTTKPTKPTSRNR